jgi:hypothetical protein
MHDTDVETLLDLDGSILDQGNGYWIKIEARRVAPTPGIPHGIAYSLTLHEPYGTRILGFDNAHAVKPPKKFKYAGRITHDHKHRRARDRGAPYEYSTAAQLLKDFFAAVDRALEEAKVP